MPPSEAPAFSFNVLSAPPPSRSPLELARDEARALDEPGAKKRFEVDRLDRALKTTVSLCATCLSSVPAFVFSRDGKVWIRKQCRKHGLSEAVLENDANYYFLSNKDKAGQVFAKDRVFDIPTFPGAEGCCEGGSCGTGDGTDQMSNKSCTVLVEVTNACNLACPVCYSDARGDRKLPREAFEKYLETLIAKKGGLDSVQLTGGEAMMHPEFWQMLAFCAGHPGIKKVYLPTNGILLLQKDHAEQLARHKAKLMVLLQFDGLSLSTNEALRSANLGKVREQVIERLGELGVFMQLTMTISRGVNEAEIGEVIRLAMKHDHIKVVALQPVTYSGRFDLDAHATERLTLSDVVKAIVNQSRKAKETDFVPIPCSHPNCGWITLFLRRFGVVHNVVKYIDLPKVLDNVAYKTLLSTDELRDAVASTESGVVKRAIGKLAKGLVRSQDMFTIAIKPFMDRHSYDQDRVDNCCHHILDTKGNPRSFCEYNAVLRQGDPWGEFPRVAV